MGMFTMRKPRGFNHPYIYVDERKENWQRWKRKPSANLACCPKRIFARRHPGEVCGRYYPFEASQGERTSPHALWGSLDSDCRPVLYMVCHQ